MSDAFRHKSPRVREHPKECHDSAMFSPIVIEVPSKVLKGANNFASTRHLCVLMHFKWIRPLMLCSPYHPEQNLR